MRLMFAAMVINAVLCSGFAYGEDGPFYEDRERGWYWYEEPEPEREEMDREPPEPSVSGSSQGQLSPREQLKVQGEQWEDAMATAILHPSPENYERYLAKTTEIQQQSQDFAKGLKEAIWTMPEYDYSLQRPTNSEAIVAKNQEELEVNNSQLRVIGETKGILFYFRSDCPYCHKMAPILKKFADTFGFSVVPVSLDGGGLPDYPYPKRDDQLSHGLKVEVVPAIFMVDPKKNKVATVSYGFTDWTTLSKKVLFANRTIEDETQIGLRAE